MENKKIIFTTILFLLLTIVGTLNVNATQEINTIEDMTNILGTENLEINETEIKLLNDIDLQDNLIIKNGSYTVDLNGHIISYAQNYNNIAFCIDGGNLTFKDETNNGQINSSGQTFLCVKGLLKIENGKINNFLGITADGIVQIDNGEFSGGVIIEAGDLIINGGIFNYGLEVAFEPFNNEYPNVTINNGEFIGNIGQDAGLYIWFSDYARNVKLKGGTFRGIDEETPGIYVGDEYKLNKLLPYGYRFTNAEQNVVEVEYEDRTSYYTTSANEVSVERYINRNIFKLIFVDYDGNVIATRNMLEGRKINLPQAPEKEGYMFVNWDINLEEINHDTVVTPNYDKIYNLEIHTIYDAYYTGEEIKPTIVIIDETTKRMLTEGEDYEIVCENNKDVGIAKVTIQGKGKYKYSNKTSEFRILPQYIDSEYKVNYEKEYVYTGSEIKPDVQVIHNNKKLINGVDYQVDYSSNINAGVGRIVIKGIGNYTGEKTETFNIKPKQINEVIVKTTDVAYTGSKIMPEVIVKSENKELSENVDYRIYYNNNVNVGTATIIVDGKGNYTGRIIKEFNIVSKNIENTNIKIDLSNKCYTGKYIKPSVTITDNGYNLKENFDYTVEYSNNLKIGKATIKIIGKKGYSGTIIKTFNIIPNTVKIKSLKTPIFRTVKLTWQKDASIDGYEIYRSTTKGGNYSLVKTIDRNNKDSHTFLAHKKGTYYYAIRCYKVVDGNKIYSDFSDVKEIKVK